MLERFTERARRVISYADTEAKLLNHEYIGCEHILLGLMKEGSGIAAAIDRGIERAAEGSVKS